MNGHQRQILLGDEIVTMGYQPLAKQKKIKLFKFVVNGSTRLVTVDADKIFKGCFYKWSWWIPYTEINFMGPHPKYPALHPDYIYTTKFWFVSKKEHNDIAAELYNYYQAQDFVNEL